MTQQWAKLKLVRAVDPEAAQQLDAIEVKVGRVVNIFAKAHFDEAREPVALKSPARFAEATAAD